MDKIKILFERLFLRSPNINVCFRILIKGNIDKKKVDTALDNVCKRHPLLNCSIEIDNEYNAWFIPNSCSPGVEYYSSEEMADWQVWYRKIENLPFDLLKGPLARICVIWGNDQMEIIVKGHHVIGDGTSYLNLSKDILLALDEKLETTPQIPPAIKFEKNIKPNILQKMYIKKLNKECRKNRVLFSEKEYLSFFREYRNTSILGLYLNSIDENNLRKIKEKCKKNKLTVTEIITSAFAIALSSGNELGIGIAVSMRNELTAKPYFCMGNFVTGIVTKINLNPKNDFMTNVNKTTKLLRKLLGNTKKRHSGFSLLAEFDNDLMESIMYAAYGNYQLSISKKIRGLIAKGLDENGFCISNLGNNELNNYEKFNLLDMQFIAPLFPITLLTISIITVNNKLNICIRYNENKLKTESVIKIYNTAIDLLCNNNEKDIK